MEAVVAPFTDADLPRIAQLIGKSNQFNLTTRRHSVQRLEEFRQDPYCVHFSLRLRDRFTDHGLVSVLIALQRGTALDIDTWLMSCRVIGRTVEAAMLSELCHAAERRGCDRIYGTYIRSSKNAMVADLFERFGFERARGGDDAVVRWEYDLSDHGSIASPFIQTGSAVDMNDGRS
jgi:FkbH-like protein